jgi:hypothetical protein
MPVGRMASVYGGECGRGGASSMRSMTVRPHCVKLSLAPAAQLKALSRMP